MHFRALLKTAPPSTAMCQCTILAGAELMASCNFLQIGAIFMGGPTTHLSQVSYYHKFKKSTYDASRNEAPAEAERGPESAELQ